MPFSTLPPRDPNQDKLRERSVDREYQQGGPKLKRKPEEENLSVMGQRLKALFVTLFALSKDRKPGRKIKEEKHSS